MTDCGVYVITCVPSGRRYVGSSLHMRKRFREHRGLLRAGKHHSLLLQRAWDKYGEAAFTFERALLCDPQNRVSYEQAVMDFYEVSNPNKGMNRAAVAKGSPPNAAFKGRKHSAESRALMSARLKGRATWNKGVPSPRKGIPRTPETSAKIAAAKRAGANATITMEIARAMRERHAGGETNVKALAATMGVSANVAYRVLRGCSWAEAA